MHRCAGDGNAYGVSVEEAGGAGGSRAAFGSENEQGKTIPKVFDWANAELPFTESEISGTTNGAGFVVNPENFADGKTYFRYHAGATNFTWTNPNPKVGAVTLRVLSWKQWDKNSTGNSSSLNILYSDGTTDIFKPLNGVVSTFTTNANKVLSQIKGNYDIENWILLDMDVLSIVANYPAPTGTVKTVNGVEPDENGNVEIAVPEGGGSGGTDIALGISGATVGQIARITAVDDAGVPTAWEAVDENTTPKLLGEVELTEDVTNPEITLEKRAKKWVLMYIHNKSEENMVENYPRINGNIVDMHISTIGANKKQWVMVELLGGGYTKWTWTNSAGGVWDGTTQSVYAKAVLYRKVNYDTYKIESIGRNGSFVAGSKIMVWGE